MDLMTLRTRLAPVLRRYRVVALAVLLGVLLMALPEHKTQPPPAENQETPALDRQLSELLSRMEGAGRVRVLLTEAQGEQVIYQSDEDRSQSELRQKTVLVDGSGREKTGLVLRVDPPRYLGAVILAEGADHAGVRLSLVEAVSRATGLSTDRITVLKMK